jgi:hypothetical protein
VNIIEENEKIVAAAVETYALGEDVHYSVSLTLMPGPNGQPMPVLIYLISIPGLGIGERMVGQTLSQNIAVDPSVEHAIKDIIEQLKSTRSQQAAEAMSSPKPQSNGQGQHHPGLIDPRQGM